jgi:ElaB/YqjD/DUF883 family membrane-anchored ribosome-binding protein
MSADTPANLDVASEITADEPAQTEESPTGLARRAKATMKEGLAGLKERSRGYADVAGEHFDTAHQYVTGRVQERPVTATLAALGVGVGVGVLVGYLLAGRKQ